jgi:hypothetical protein
MLARTRQRVGRRGRLADVACLSEPTGQQTARGWIVLGDEDG